MAIDPVTGQETDDYFDIAKFEQLLERLEGSKKRQQRQKSVEGRRDIFATGLAGMMGNFWLSWTMATPNVEDTYTTDDWFDLDKYRQAAGVAYEFSKKKLEDTGAQERETIGKGATEQRTSAEQAQRYRQEDEARDYGQAQRAYRYWGFRPMGR